MTDDIDTAAKDLLKEHDLKMRQYNYDLYSEIIDSVLENYDVSEDEAIEAVASYCEQAEQEAAEEKRQDLNDRAPEVAIDIAYDQAWEPKDGDDED